MKMKTRITTQVKQIFENAPPKKSVPSYLVCYDGGPASLAALRQACEMASKQTRLVAVYLDVLPETENLENDAPANEMRGQAILAAAIANARMRGVKIETQIIPCHVKGPALVSLAAESNSSILFVGIEEHEIQDHSNPFTTFVLSMAPCKVVLVGVRDSIVFQK